MRKGGGVAPQTERDDYMAAELRVVQEENQKLRVRVYIYIYMCVYIYIYMCVCVCVCVCVEEGGDGVPRHNDVRWCAQEDIVRLGAAAVDAHVALSAAARVAELEAALAEAR